jgi:Domain of unknown function (DUF4124)
MKGGFLEVPECLSVSDACSILAALLWGRANMKRYLFAVLCVCPLLVQAEIYKAVDADGHVTYSSTPIKGGKKLILEPLPTMMPAAKPHANENFPKVDNETQRGRDETRRKILQDELNTEEKLLAEARQNLTEGESNPEVYKGTDGRTYRNVAKYDEKIKPLQDQVDLHNNNIAALKTELSRLQK